MRPAPRMLARTGAVAAALLIVVLGSPVGVAGHGGEAGIEIVPGQVHPGEQVVVYGEDLEPATEVGIQLLTGSGDISLGDFDTDPDGHLVAEVTVPEHLGPRVYELRVTGLAATDASSYVTVLEADSRGVEPAFVVAFLLPLVLGVLVIAGARGVVRTRGQSAR